MPRTAWRWRSCASHDEVTPPLDAPASTQHAILLWVSPWRGRGLHAPAALDQWTLESSSSCRGLQCGRSATKSRWKVAMLQPASHQPVADELLAKVAVEASEDCPDWRQLEPQFLTPRAAPQPRRLGRSKVVARLKKTPWPPQSGGGSPLGDPFPGPGSMHRTADDSRSLNQVSTSALTPWRGGARIDSLVTHRTSCGGVQAGGWCWPR